MKQTSKALAMILGGWVAIAAAIPAQAAASRWMDTSGITSSPIGHVKFCRKHPSECRHKSRDTAPPVLTEALWSQLIDVNNDFNLSIKVASGAVIDVVAIA